MNDKIHFEVTSSLGKRIRVTKDYWVRIIQTKHRIMAGKEEIIKETLKSPEEIRISRKYPSVYLYYRKIKEYYNCVVVKHLNGEGFIITTYITDRIKAGEKYETD